MIYELKDEKRWEFSAQNGVYHELFKCAKNTVLCKLMNYELKTKQKWEFSAQNGVYHELFECVPHASRFIKLSTFGFWSSFFPRDFAAG